MPRPRITDKLSPDATGIMMAGFGEHKPDGVIVDEIFAATGEVVSERTIGRRKSEHWGKKRARDQRYEHNLAVFEAARDSKLAPETALAILDDSLLRRPGVADELEPEELFDLHLKAQAETRKQQEAGIKERQVALEEKKFAETMKAKVDKMRDAAKAAETEAKKSGNVSPEVIRRIEEIYGIADAA